MKYKLIVTSKPSSTPETSSPHDSTESQLRALKALSSSSAKCDTQLPATQLHIGDKSVAEVVKAIESALGKDVTCTVLVPCGKAIGELGVATIVVESGEPLVVAEQNEETPKPGAGEDHGVISAAIGNFNSSELRPWWELRDCDVKELSFFGFPNRGLKTSSGEQGKQNEIDVLMGITHLDFDHEQNIRFRGYAEQQQQARDFKFKLETWADSKMYCSGCDWLAFPRASCAPCIQYGSFNTTEDHPWDQPQPSTTRYVSFDKEYTEEEGIPRIAIWFNSLDVDRTDATWSVRTYVSNVSRKGFTINISSGPDTALWSAGVSWISHPEGLKGISSRETGTTRRLVGGEEEFESCEVKFGQGAWKNVFVGLSELHAPGWVNTRVRLGGELDNGAVKLNVATWENSVVEALMAAVVVLE